MTGLKIPSGRTKPEDSLALAFGYYYPTPVWIKCCLLKRELDLLLSFTVNVMKQVGGYVDGRNLRTMTVFDRFGLDDPFCCHTNQSSVNFI